MKKTLYEQQGFPIFQNKVYETQVEAKNCLTGDIKIVQDLSTGLIFNENFRPELMSYDSGYDNEQGHSKLFQKHLEQVSRIVDAYLGKKNLVEIGCGKGSFLELLLKGGSDVYGFDPTYEGENKRVIKKYYEPNFADGSAAGLILRHVLEHIADPIEFLFQLKKTNQCKGLVYIEVPCFDWIIKNNAWFDIFYEHVNYFRLSDFYRLFNNVIAAGRFFGGQYIYCVAELASLKAPQSNRAGEVEFPSEFLCGVRRQTKESVSLSVWGAGSKGVIYSHLRKKYGLQVDMIVDINPSKQGKYLPLSGIQVSAPDEFLKKASPHSTIVVMNDNYLEEIKEMTGGSFNYASSTGW